MDSQVAVSHSPAGRLALVHTVPPLVEVFSELCAELLPGVRLMHILDEPLLERVAQRGGLAEEDAARLDQHGALAEQACADVVLVTCSTISPCVDRIRASARTPVLKIDEIMIAAAVARGGRIGVAATNATTLRPTALSLETEARRVGKPIEVEQVLVEGALPALLRGDAVTHDRLVCQAVLELAERTDVVVLAQASMARVLAVLPPRTPETASGQAARDLRQAGRPVPILSSPHLALAHIRTLLEGRRDATHC